MPRDVTRCTRNTRDAMQTRRGFRTSARTRMRRKTRPIDTVARASLPLTARRGRRAPRVDLRERGVARNFAPLLRAGESTGVPAAVFAGLFSHNIIQRHEFYCNYQLSLILLMLFVAISYNLCYI